MKTTIAVDLDGTLAEYTHWCGTDHIGDPIPLMVNRVKGWVNAGFEVVIFTARIEGEFDTKAIATIHAWLEKQGLPRLEVTNIKRKEFSCIYDDRCVQVEPNTGRIVTEQVQTWIDGIQRILNVPR